METATAAAWRCSHCECNGRGLEPVTCWNCGNTEVTITARFVGDRQLWSLPVEW